MKVLIVDDIEESRLLLHDLMTSQGYDSIQAEDGRSALELVRRERPDIVISDIQMPVMDGFELCEQIKQDPQLRDTFFVFYTGTFVEPEDERLALDLGASCFVRKPAEPGEFLAIIKSVLAQQRSGTLPVPPKPALPASELAARHRERLTSRLDKKTKETASARRAYATLISNLPGMVYRCRNDTDWSMEFISDACQDLIGYPAEALIGNRDVAYGELIHQDDRERVWQAVQTARELNQPFQLEYRLRRQDDTVIWVWEQGRCINPGGSPELLEGYISDVTALRRAESEKKRFFELSLDMLCIAGMDGYFKQLSPAFTRILGWSESEMLARPWIDLVHPDDRDSTEQARVTLVEGRQVLAFDNRFLHKDGSYRWLSWSSMPMPEDGLMYGVARDITDRIEDQHKLERLNRTLLTLGAGNRALVHVMDEQQLLDEMCRVVVDSGGYRMAWVGYARQDEGRTIELIAQHSSDNYFSSAKEFGEKLRLTWGDTERGQGPSAKAIRLGTTQVVADIQNDPAMLPWRELAREYDYATEIALPLIRQGQPFGALTILSDRKDQFVPEEITLLEELASDLSYGIASHRVQMEKSRAERNLEQSLLQAIQAIAITVEKRDPYTAGHQSRVAQLAMAIATEMQLPKHQIDGIRLGATIHDIGKISVPAEILSRPGRLAEIEFGIIKTHPDIGYEIVKDIPFPWPIAEMVHQHHERLDGSGYPQGLKGDEIILEARIIAVADVVEAITSHRPYRPALGIEAAIEEISKNKGKWYEPDSVDACVRLIREGRFEFT